jgi:type III secretion protein C
VEDRQTTLRGTTLTTPGVLTVMLNLLGLPNQRMTASPENKTAGMISDASGLLSAMGRPLQEDTIRSSPSAPTTTRRQTKPDDKPREELPLSVTADPRTNSILIRDAKSKYEYYRELIEKLDKQVQMIEVEAMLVEVTQSGLNQLGLEFGYQSGHLQYEFSSAAAVGTNNLIPAGTASIVDPARFVARLKALSADQNAKVLARPTIVTQDNASAYIDLSQTLYLQITGERIANAMPVTAGSLLQVTPRVVRESGEEKIFVKIEIQDGSINRNIIVNGFPAVENTSLSTQALIQREKAILIGGYNREAAGEKEYRVPFLGNLPYIGKAFKSTETNNETRLRLFLITPRLIEEPAQNSVSTREAIMVQKKHFGLNGENLEAEPSLKLDRIILR